MNAQSRKRLTLVILGALAAAGVGAWWWSEAANDNSASWFCSPTASRFDRSGYQYLKVTEGVDIPPSADYEQKFVRRNEEYIAVKEVGSRGKWKPPVDLIEADSDLTIDLPGGAKLEVVAVSTSILTPENYRTWQSEGQNLMRRG